MHAIHKNCYLNSSFINENNRRLVYCFFSIRFHINHGIKGEVVKWSILSTYQYCFIKT